jgi:hypothetical protein
MPLTFAKNHLPSPRVMIFHVLQELAGGEGPGVGRNL